MDKSELLAPLVARNQAAEESRIAAEQLDGYIDRLIDMHREAGEKAARIVDHYQAPFSGVISGSEGFHRATRITPPIPLGPVDSGPDAEFTHGFAQVAVDYETEPKKEMIKPPSLFSAATYEFKYIPTHNVASVSVSILGGDEEGKKLAQISEELKTSPENPLYRNVSNESVVAIQEKTQKLIESLDLIAQEVGVVAAVNSDSPAATI
jgi:hypothetical protein